MNEKADRLFARYTPGRPCDKVLPEPEVRVATIADALAVARLIFERDGSNLATLQQRLTNQLSDPSWAERKLLMVAQVKQEVVGFGRVGYFAPPADAPPNAAPAGWYLGGVIVDPAYRRQGIAAALTRQRLDWIATRADRAFYFVNAQNQASVDLHRQFEFVELSQDFWYPGVSFLGGVGILYQLNFASFVV